MLKGLKRKLVILSVLAAAAFAAVSSAPAAHAGGVFCFDDGIGANGCFGWVCCSDGLCWCH